MTPTKKYSDSPEDAFRRITRGLIAWRESTTVAMALIYEAIEREIWKLKYDSKKEYFELECKITEQWGHELYAASKAIEGLKSLESKSGKSLGFLDDLTPSNLGPVKHEKPEKVAAIITNAKNNQGAKPITKKAVQKAKDEYEMQEPKEMQEPAEPEVVRDELGWPIPKENLDLWHRRSILEDMMADLSRIKCTIEKGQAAEDHLFTAMSNGVISELQGVRWALKNARPWIVCTQCEGRPRLNGACTLCHSTGFLHERDTETLPTVRDALALRTKVLASKK